MVMESKMKRFVLFLFAIFINIATYAQTETIKWYVNGELYDTTTCESGGDITPPNIDNFGYTFAGWEPAIYDMSTLDASINGTRVGDDGCVNFSYGRVCAKGICSPTNGNDPTAVANGIDTTSGGNYCWCRLTSFIPTGETKIYEPLQGTLVYDRNLSSCKDANCTSDCGQYLANGANNQLRVRLYNAN